MAKKKAIILIVEGITDQMIFQEYLDKLINHHQFFVKVINGDVFTSDLYTGLTPKQIVGEVMKLVRQQTKFQVSDIAFIAQLIDTDGIFIPKEDYQVSEKHGNQDGKTYRYDIDDGKVYVSSDTSLEKLLNNWQRKKNTVLALRKGINYTSSKIPFLLYYNSLNLEHVTHDRILAGDEKQLAAVTFIESLEDDIQKFIAFFESETEADTYDESWNRVIEGDNWVRPMSNLKFLVDKLAEIEKIK